MTRRKNKPMTPEEAHKLLAERREREADIADLKRRGARVTTDRAGRVVSAYRSNVFNLLLERKAITPNQHDAAYRLSVDWAAWRGLDGKPEGVQVDGGLGCRELVTDRMIAAGLRVEWALSQVPDHALLRALMVATVEEDRPMMWRGLVQKATGKTDAEAQTRAVVRALERLRAVYEQPRALAA